MNNSPSLSLARQKSSRKLDPGVFRSLPSGKCPEQLTRTFAFSHTVPLEKSREYMQSSVYV